MKVEKLIAILVALAAAGAGAWWLLARSTKAAAPVGGPEPPPLPQTPQPPASGGGVNPKAVISAVASTVSTVGGLLAAGATVAVAPAAVAAVPAAGAIGASVGGSTVAGSVAATQASTAAAAAGPAASATSGGTAGLGAFFTNPWTIGIGAALVVAGFIVRARRNETKDDREDFCESLGFYTVEGYAFGKEIRKGSMDQLYEAMLSADPVVGQELWIEATQQIGKHDKTRNTAWCHKVLQLFGLEAEPTVAAGLPYDAPFEFEQTETMDDPLLEMMA